MINFQERDEARGFVHKKLFGVAKFAVSTFVPGGSTAVGVFNSLTRRRQRATASKAVTRTAKFGGNESNAGCPRGSWRDGQGRCRTDSGSGPIMLAAGTGGPGAVFQGSAPSRALARTDCTWPARIDPLTGQCRIFLGEVSGPDPEQPTGHVSAPGTPGSGSPAPQGVVPAIRDGVRRRCPKRYVLGINNLCYFGLARNSKFRKWRPGRKPMFTGGDLNAIDRADKLSDGAEEIFKKTNPAKKAVARSYRANWRKPLKK